MSQSISERIHGRNMKAGLFAISHITTNLKLTPQTTNYNRNLENADDWLALRSIIQVFHTAQNNLPRKAVSNITYQPSQFFTDVLINQSNLHNENV